MHKTKEETGLELHLTGCHKFALMCVKDEKAPELQVFKEWQLRSARTELFTVFWVKHPEGPLDGLVINFCKC